MLIGFVFMFFGYSAGVFEWHLPVIFSNIIGVCIVYSGYFYTQPLRKLHLSYPLSVYGLGNLLLLALRLNDLTLEDFVYDNPLTVLLAILISVCTVAVLYYPSLVFIKMFRTLSEEYGSTELIPWFNGLERSAVLLILLIGLSFYAFPIALSSLISVYMVLHYVVIARIVETLLLKRKATSEKAEVPEEKEL